MDFADDKYIKIILTGNRKIEIENLKILKLLANQNIIKISDKTKLEIDLDVLSKQNNLKGLFVKTLLERLDREPENKNKLQKAIEVGLSSFN